jgi:histidinol-phosphatase (PHP family)
MKYDYHIHTSFSFDSKASLESVVKKSISLGLSEIAITDHVDFSFPSQKPLMPQHIGTMVADIQKIQEQYKNTISILIGAEFSLRTDLAGILDELTKAYDFDFIIGSTHDIEGIDFSSEAPYENISKQQAYDSYFINMLDVITDLDSYDVVGHLDYVQRYGKYEDKSLLYSNHSDIIDEILKTIIHKGKGIEINTSGYRYNLDKPHPSSDIIKRYHELGGEIITLGSDAHFVEHITDHFDTAIGILRAVGFKHITRFKNRKPSFVQI